MTEIPPSVLLYSTLATFAGTRAISSLPEAMEDQLVGGSHHPEVILVGGSIGVHQGNKAHGCRPFQGTYTDSAFGVILSAAEAFSEETSSGSCFLSRYRSVSAFR